MTVFVSMLRGVNVGGSGRIKMRDLQAAYEAVGLRDVQTLLQSGNVLFRTSVRDRAALARRIKQEIERRFDLQIEVLLRTLAELKNVVERGPVLPTHADPAKLLVMFLGAVPDARTQTALQKAHTGPEMIEMRGPEIYLYYPDGVGRSKVSGAWLENRLKVSGTARNWNTLEKLVAAGEALERGEKRE
jgi:uncharacterized protein (DUF1697 family)